MSPREPERRELEPSDERLLARLREEYAPEPQTPAQRAAFDAALRTRIERRAGRLWLPAGLAAGTAAALLALVLAGPAREPAESSSSAGADLAGDLLLADAGSYGEGEDTEGDALPPQYAAIASVLLVEP